MTLFLVCFTCGASFLLSLLLFFHPLQQNVKANQWLGFFVFTMGCAFMSTFLIITGYGYAQTILFKCLNCIQFLLAPTLFISILHFVNPTKEFTRKDWIHFAPFALYSIAEFASMPGTQSFSTIIVFAINKDVSFLVRDILPFVTLFYLIKSYILLLRHRANLKLLSSSIRSIDLGWLIQFLFILVLTLIIWINDSFFDFPLLTEAMPFVYAGSIFFLAYFAIRQKAIFAFKQGDMKEISRVLDNEAPRDPTQKQKEKVQRLSQDEIEILSARLLSMMEKEKLFLDNDLSLPAVAEKLGIGIHETSFLINETTKTNFYNFVNAYRVEEAKKLLASSKMEELNILGIAFASGFNSKTTFNTQFKKIVGSSPSEYSKKQRK